MAGESFAGWVIPKHLIDLDSLGAGLSAQNVLWDDLKDALSTSQASIMIRVIFPASHTGNVTVNLYAYCPTLKTFDTEPYHSFALTSVNNGPGQKTEAINLSGIQGLRVIAVNNDGARALGAVDVFGTFRK